MKIDEQHFYLTVDGVAVCCGDDEMRRKRCIAVSLHIVGSILSVFDENGERVFRASYDPWGKQTVITNKIGLRRGYTAHEMIPEFGIINMNGRLYDPVLGRFFSPDNFVQLPGNTQSYNRYSYCLNNPLKYTDPSGQSFGLAFALFNMATSMMQAAFNGDDVLKAGFMNLWSSVVSYGIGNIFSSVAGVGHELLRAGAHGLAGGLTSMLNGGNFGVGFASGAISSGFGSFVDGVKMPQGLRTLSSAVMGGIAAWATGGDFLEGAMQGMRIALLNHAVHHVEVTGHKNTTDPNIECEVEVIGYTSEKYYTEKFLDYGAIAISIPMQSGESLIKKSGNSTVGDNYRFYFHKAGKRGFYGNPYVKVERLSIFGKILKSAFGPVSKGIDAGKIIRGLSYDLADLNSQGYTNGYNTARASADVGGGMAGAIAGMKIGGEIGCAIGSFFWGAGAIPGTVIGGAVGAVVGGIFFSKISTLGVDKLYGY